MTGLQGIRQAAYREDEQEAKGQEGKEAGRIRGRREGQDEMSLQVCFSFCAHLLFYVVTT